MKNFNFFEKLWEHSRTLRRVGLVLVMCLVAITQAYASDPHFHLTGKTPTGSWSNSATEWKLSSPASSALSNGATFDEYCTYMWLSEGDYFGLNNGTDRYSRNDNNDQEIKGDKYGAGVFGYPTKEGKTDKAFHYIGATGLVRINAAQTGSGDSYGNQGQYYPYIWVEESLETAILTGSKIMFYFGIADSWKTNWFYLSKEGDQNNNKSYKAYYSTATKLETRIAVAYVDANTTYYIASAQSGGTCIKMSSNAAAGNLYSLNSSGGNNIYVNTGNVPHFATTSVSKEVGTTNSTIAATDVNSIYGNAYTFHYYYTTDGGSTFTKFDPTDISDLTTGRYIVYALGWDGHILVKSDNSVTLDITVPITLNANGGSDGAVTSINATYGVAASTGNIAGGSLPTKIDYVFTGFYTSGGTKVIDADGEWVSDVSGYTNAGGNWTCTAASTLYAHWEDRYGFYGTGGDLGSWDVWKGLPNTATNTYSKSYSLTKNTTYIFKIVDRNGSGTWWGNSNTSGNLSITRSESGSAQQLYNTGGKSDNITITPDVTGSYTFSYNSSTNKLTITYPESYKVTYHNNGSTSGSVPTDDDYYLAGATVTAKDNTGKLIASESGKVFAGWNTASDGSGAFVDPADTENNTFTISSTAHDLYPVWKDGYYLITPGGTSFNLTPSAPFTTGKSIGSGSAVSVNGISSAYWWTISGSSSACNVYNVVYDKDRHLLYDTQTDDEDIYVYVRGTGNLHYAIYKDGEAYTAAASDTVAIGAEKVFHFSIQHSLKSRLVLSASSTSPKITNIRVVKNGSALAAPCTAGYQLSFPGRAGVAQNSNYTIDGITLNTKADMKFGTGSMKLNSTSNYIQFTTASAIQLQVKISANQQFYVCTNKSSAAATGSLYGGTSGQTYNINLGSANTYYIVGNGSDITIDKIAFAAASCSTPTSPSISGTTAYNAGDNIELTASVTGTISGTTTYQWYKGDPENDGVSQGDASTSGATLTINSCVTGDAGTYYCVISNGDGCTVTTYQAITVSCLTAPVAVTSLTNSVHTTNSLTYTWTKASNASGYTATLYSDEDCTVSVEAKALGDVATVTFSDLTPNTTYYCKVQSKGNGTVYCEDGGTTTTAVSGKTDAPSVGTFTPASGSTVKSETTVTVTGSTGSTVYYLWGTSSAPSASDVVSDGTAGTSGAATVTTSGISSTKTYLYAVAVEGGVNSAISSASYTIDDTKPTLSSSTPADDATGVNTSGNIVLTFSENVTIADASKFSLSGGTLSTGSASVSGAVVTIPYSGLSNSTEYTFSTTAGAVQDAVGNTNAALDDISFTTKAAPTCSGDPSALANEKLYKVEDMASACADDLSASGQYKYGLSSNGKFYVVGTTDNNDGSTGTVEMKTDVSLSNVGGDADADFTNSAWLKMAGSTSHHSIKFVIPTGGGKLYVYGKGGGSKDGKGNVQIKENSTSIVTEVIAKTSSSACKSSAISVNAGTYYIYSSGESAALYGIYFDKAPELSSSDPANGDTDVPVSGTIVLTFDESIADVDDEKFTLSSGSISAVAVDGTDDTKVNITYSDLPGSTDITLSVAAGAVTDAAGNTSAALSDIAFTTVATGYAITNANPDHGTIAITDGSSDITEAEEDATVYIAATPATGYEFTSWDVYKTSDSETKVSLADDDDASTSFEMPAYAVTVDATFTAIDYDITHTATENGTYTISVAGGAATDENTTANYGQTITLAATPSSHYKLQAWNVTKTSSGDEITVTDNEFTMPAEAVTIAPTFGRVYTVTFRAYGGSSVSPIEQSTIGGSITMPSTTTSNDSTFTGWMIGGTTVAAGASYTPTADVYAYATWQKNCAGGSVGGTLYSLEVKSSGDDVSLARQGGSMVLTTDNYLSTLTGGIAKLVNGNPGSGSAEKMLGTESSEYHIRFTNDNHYIKVGLNTALAAGDTIKIKGNTENELYITTSSTRSTSYKTSSQKYLIPAESTFIDKDTIYIWRYSGTTAVKSISIIRPSSGSCYHITYDGNGADAGYENDARAYSSGDNAWVSTNSSSSNFSREGYEFNGWNNKADGSGTYYNYWTNSDKVVITKDTTLYAQWKIVVDEDNVNLSGFDTPQYKDVVVRNGAKLTITQNMSVRNITVESGSTLHVAKNGEEGITLSIDSLSLVGGYYMKKDYSTVYDMPRVYIDPLSTLSRSNSTINFDFAVTNQYHPIAVPFPVKVSDVKYAKESLRAITTYGTHYLIKTYDGAARANGSYACWTFVSNKKYNEDTEVYEDTYLQPGRGYILAAIRGKGDPYAFIRFPMKNVPSAWTTLGEQGTVDDVTKNVVAVEAYLKDGDADGSKTPNANKGWNILGVPFMSRYQATDDIIQSPTEIIQGHFDYSTNKWDDDEIRYVTVPTYDFSEYNQYSIEDEGTILLPGWCFFVQVKTSGNLKFLSEAEAEAAKDQAMPIYAPRREQEHKPTVKTGIILSGANASDKTTIIVSDKYNAAEYEINADLEKMFGENGYTLATYTLSGETRLAYNAMNNADIMNVIPVGYRAPEEGEYTFSINPRYAESEAFEQVNLIDYEEGVITNLLQSSYSFTTARTQNDARFAINVVKRQDMPTDIETVGSEGINDANAPRKVLINDKMYIILDGKMYDATGKAVK